MAKKLTTEKFIEKAKAVHGDKYDYSKVEYVNTHTKVCIICPEHGEFWQKPNTHLNGSGCTICNNNNETKNTKEFIKKAKSIHGDKYDYSKVNYVNNCTKVCIICPIHGEFWQIPRNHYHNGGCYLCGKESMKVKRCMSIEEFVKRAVEIHGNKYDYSKVVLNGSFNNITIICPEHGEFQQTPSAHINNKHGCPICGRISANNSKKLTNDVFIEKAKKIHGDKYDYSKVDYIDYNTHVTIICPEHGEFQQTPDSHLQGKGCSKCSHSQSNDETEIKEYIEQFHVKVEERQRNVIPPYEIDIFLPEINVGIEYNGIRWHTDKFKTDNNYHLKKTELCKSRGISLLHIFEDEYKNHKDIVLNKIRHIISLPNALPKIYGRKCSIKEITYNVSTSFLNDFHIQGGVSSTVYYGAFYEDKLIAVMTFKRERTNSNSWELTRFASDYNYVCCGVGGKLFKHFVKKYNPETVKSFADRRWTINEENNLYLQLGFEFDGYTKPDYHYVINNIMKRIHKFNFRKKNILKEYGERYSLTIDMTEKEMTEKLKIYRIYDCGLIKYIWRKGK